MKVRFLNECDFVNYKKPSMFIGAPTCDWKCERESGCSGLCQNSALAKEPTIEISVRDIFNRYKNNPITNAVVIGGLEPMDSWDDLQALVQYFRYYILDDIVIYTGYRQDEIQDKIKWLSLYENIIVKFGRYVPGGRPHRDEILGVDLASDNQYAEYIGERI